MIFIAKKYIYGLESVLMLHSQGGDMHTVVPGGVFPILDP